MLGIVAVFGYFCKTLLLCIRYEFIHAIAR
nr:MAG TPA: hypothetical protein [Caudoviricetes sp.]